MLKILNEEIEKCTLCPRLVDFRQTLPKRASFKNEQYHRKPVTGFGDSEGWLLLSGLAPAAHGGNRTGRLFTGDESGRFLIKVLHQAGFANQPYSHSKEDGLILNQVYITPAVKCVPPGNKPNHEEFRNCQHFYKREMELLTHVKVILALGKMAFDATLHFLDAKKSLYPFFHGACYSFSRYTLYASYHPSPQNTYRKTLTEDMLFSLLQDIKKSRLHGMKAAIR